ncbi:MAG: sigma 54-interacting transcriptional regulator [Firmicutes bacterium]|nr:sigma 54-interacting transcriptional regulator [Bacillota bacterium]
MLGEIWERFAGRRISDVFFGLAADGRPDDKGTLCWEETRFEYMQISGEDGDRLLLKQAGNREFLLERALDLVGEGVQIYDRNAYAVFFNERSRRISEIRDEVRIEGMHLLDMYPLDEEISTTLTTLRTGQPVIDRVDHFNTTDGSYIATANTAYPIRRDGEVIGSVVFEQDKSVVADYLRRMNSIETALDSYGEADQYLRFSGYTFRNILGEGRAMREAVDIARKISDQECDVLLVGETGTGKELFAQAIHNESLRKGKKFLAINCAAIPESLIEGLLFGTVRGSFTGSEDRAGYLEESSGGTLFLDELNSMSLMMQSKLLRAVQERTIRRVGGSADIRIDVRFISSCNEDPFTAIRENRLRRDLFYRLSTVMINLPSLREHPEDIEALAQARIRNSNQHFVNKIKTISPEVLQFLKAYDWPGNVRELFHVIDYAMNIAETDRLEMHHLPRYLTQTAGESQAVQPVGFTEASSERHPSVPCPRPDWRCDTLQTIMDTYEEQVLRAALEQYGGNITKTAEALDVKRQSLQYRIRKYGIII